MFLKGSPSQRIKLTGLDIGLDLTIPDLGIIL